MAGGDLVAKILTMVELSREGLRSKDLNSEEYNDLDRQRLGIMFSMKWHKPKCRLCNSDHFLIFQVFKSIQQ